MPPLPGTAAGSHQSRAEPRCKFSLPVDPRRFRLLQRWRSRDGAAFNEPVEGETLERMCSNAPFPFSTWKTVLGAAARSAGKGFEGSVPTGSPRGADIFFFQSDFSMEGEKNRQIGSRSSAESGERQSQPTLGDGAISMSE